MCFPQMRMVAELIVPASSAVESARPVKPPRRVQLAFPAEPVWTGSALVPSLLATPTSTVQRPCRVGPEGDR